jgi:hypothetical protein
MDYQIVLSPTLPFTPEALIAAWNDDPDCRATARATRLDAPPAGYPIDPGTVLVFLGGVATTIATKVVTDLLANSWNGSSSQPSPHPPRWTL